MSKEQGPVFVERRTYRRRRMVDAARLLPILGIVLVCLPLLWTSARAVPTTTTYAMIYFFGLWLFLAVAAALLSRHLKHVDSEEDEDRPTTAPDKERADGGV